MHLIVLRLSENLDFLLQVIRCEVFGSVLGPKTEEQFAFVGDVDEDLVLKHCE